MSHNEVPESNLPFLSSCKISFRCHLLTVLSSAEEQEVPTSCIPDLDVRLSRTDNGNSRYQCGSRYKQLQFTLARTYLSFLQL